MQLLQDLTDFLWPTVLTTHLHASLWFVAAALGWLLFRRRIPATCMSLLWLIVIMRFLIPSLATGGSMFEMGYRMPNLVEAELPQSSLSVDPFRQTDSTEVVTVDLATGSPLTVQDCLIALWVTGMIFLFSRYFVSAWKIRKLLRDAQIPADTLVRMTQASAERAGLRTAPTIRITEGINAPCLAGWLRPIMLIDPENARTLSTRELKHVFQHECEHLRRADPARLFLAQLACIVGWWNPIVWFAARSLRRTCEEACDTATLHRLGEEERKPYGETILAVAARSSGVRLPAPHLSVAGGVLRRRLIAIAKGSSPSVWKEKAISVSITLLAILTLAVPLMAEEIKQTAQEDLVNTSFGVGTEKVVALLERSRLQADLSKIHSVHLETVLKGARANGIPLDRDNSMAKVVRALDCEIGDKRPFERALKVAWNDTQIASMLLLDDGGYSLRHWDGAVGTYAHKSDGKEETKPNWSLQKDFQNFMAAYSPGGLHYYLYAIARGPWWSRNSSLGRIDRKYPWTNVEGAIYEEIGMEKFGGERCHVVDSYVRSERLYISAKTGRLRGWALISDGFSRVDHNEENKNRWRELAREASGQEFKSPGEYGNWLKQQPLDRQISVVHRVGKRLVKEWGVKMMMIYRFSNHEEIDPGCWLPMTIEASLLKGTGDGRYDCVKTVMTVTKVRVGRGIDELKAMLPSPNKGDQVADSRFGATVRYTFDPARKETEIRKLAAAQREKDDRHKTDRAARTADLQKLVGKSIGKLTWMDGIWLNGQLPSDADRREKPMLLHFWFKECGPCKNDYPVLNKLKNRYHVIGVHIPTKDFEGVKAAIKNGKMNYPTFVAPKLTDPSLVAGMPVREFPTCVVVDRKGMVESFGSLTEVIEQK